MKASRTQEHSDKGGMTSQRPEKVAMVFQRDAPEVRMMIRALLADGSSVTAITKSLNPSMEAFLLTQKNVTIKVVDTTSCRALSKAIRGSDRAVLETKYWEQFASAQEELQAEILLEACHVSGVSNCLFNTVEDIKYLREKGLQSQIVPDQAGRVHATFDGMQDTKQIAQELGVHLNHMITSYIDNDNTKKSLCLISGENGKLISVPYYGATHNMYSSDETEASSVCSMSSDEAIASVPKDFVRDEESGSIFGRLPLTHWILGIGVAALLVSQGDLDAFGKDAFLSNDFLF